MRRTACALLLFGLAPAVSLYAEGPRGLAWEVKDASQSLYVAGSVHLQKEGPQARLPPAYLELFDRSSCLVLETDPGALAGAEFSAMVQESGLLPETTDLERELDPGTWQRLSERIAKLGRTPEEFRRLRPWLAALLLTRYELERLGYRPELGVDERFYRLAREVGKELVFLESPAEQLEHLAGLEPETARELLRQLVRDLDQMETSVTELTAAWADGDIQAMEEATGEGFRPSPGLRRRLIEERNRAWAKRIGVLLDQKRSCLVLVGSAHLVGPQNLVDLLAAHGLEIRRR